MMICWYNITVQLKHVTYTVKKLNGTGKKAKKSIKEQTLKGFPRLSFMVLLLQIDKHTTVELTVLLQ